MLTQVGSFIGYSAVAIASTLPPGGRMVCVDACPDCVETAQAVLKLAGLSDKVTAGDVGCTGWWGVMHAVLVLKWDDSGPIAAFGWIPALEVGSPPLRGFLADQSSQCHGNGSQALQQSENYDIKPLESTPLIANPHVRVQSPSSCPSWCSGLV